MAGTRTTNNFRTSAAKAAFELGATAIPLNQTFEELTGLGTQMKCQGMETLDPIVRHEWDFSTWFAFLSPVLGVALGFLSLLILAR